MNEFNYENLKYNNKPNRENQLYTSASKYLKISLLAIASILQNCGDVSKKPINPEQLTLLANKIENSEEIDRLPSSIVNQIDSMFHKRINQNKSICHYTLVQDMDTLRTRSIFHLGKIESTYTISGTLGQQYGVDGSLGIISGSGISIAFNKDKNLVLYFLQSHNEIENIYPDVESKTDKLYVLTEDGGVVQKNYHKGDAESILNLLLKSKPGYTGVTGKSKLEY
jgi:hypothetical protein